MQSFLCSQCRDWLSHQADQNYPYYSRVCDVGRYYYQQKNWEEALPYIGCAFETAEIMLENRVLLPVLAINCLLHATTGLTSTLLNLGRVVACREVYKVVLSVLEKEAETYSELKPSIDLEITRLTKELRRLDCCSELFPWVANKQENAVVH